MSDGSAHESPRHDAAINDGLDSQDGRAAQNGDGALSSQTVGLAPQLDVTGNALLHGKTRQDAAWAIAIGWVVVAVVIIGGWQVAAATNLVSPTFFGEPSAIWASLLSGISGTMLRVDAVATTVATVTGFCIAAVAGILAAFLLTRVSFLRAVVNPYLTALNSLPRIALAPVFVIWFGIGLVGHAFIAGSLTFFVVLANTMAGVDSVDPDHLLLAKLQGASPWQEFWKFIVPSSLPSIFVGLELGFIFGMLGEVSGEMVSGSSGLGVRLTADGSQFAMNDYFATLVLLTFITTVFALMFKFIGHRMLLWQRITTGSGG